MDIVNQNTDETVLAEVGARLAAVRLSRNVTQAGLARDAGLSKRTVERIEAGHSVQLTNFIRILRALDRLADLGQMLPPAEPGPMDLLRRGGKAPRRATGDSTPADEPWSWADES